MLHHLHQADDVKTPFGQPKRVQLTQVHIETLGPHGFGRSRRDLGPDRRPAAPGCGPHQGARAAAHVEPASIRAVSLESGDDFPQTPFHECGDLEVPGVVVLLVALGLRGVGWQPCDEQRPAAAAAAHWEAVCGAGRQAFGGETRRATPGRHHRHPLPGPVIPPTLQCTQGRPTDQLSYE